MTQQHATWIAQARAHLKEHRPQALARLQAAGTLEQHLREAAEATSREMQTLMRQGANWQEAWEMVREQHLFPPAEEAKGEAMPASEGFRAHRDLTRSLGSLTMPGEKDQPE